MNQIHQNNCRYLTPNRTIEELLVFNDHNTKVFYIYNFKGTSFRLFSSKDHLEKFFNNDQEETIHFTSEEDLDRHLFQITI